MENESTITSSNTGEAHPKLPTIEDLEARHHPDAPDTPDVPHASLHPARRRPVAPIARRSRTTNTPEQHAGGQAATKEASRMAKRKPKRNPRKIPYVMLLKEFTDLTGDTTQAILLARLENLTRQKQDFDEYVEEEIARVREADEDEPTLPLTHAWIWKKAEELAKESLLVSNGKPLSGPTIRKHLKAMVERGWLDERRNPRHNWDRTLQYRVNLIAIEHDLNEIGHTLPGWTFEDDDADDSTPDTPNVEPSLASASNFVSKQEDFPLNQNPLVSKDENFGAIPDSDTTLRPCSRSSCSGKRF